MLKPFFVLILCLMQTLTLLGQDAGIGDFNEFTHIGNAEKKGVIQYDADSQEYTLEGASGNMWNDKDDFHFLWKKMKGDFMLTVQTEFLSKGVDPHRKVGWMIRNSLESNSPQINAVVHGDGLTSLQYRKTAGGETEEVKSADKGPDVIQLERRGTKYIMSTAKFGENFTAVEVTDVALSDDVYVGIFLCSHNEAVVEKASFRNVRIVVPPGEGFVQYKQYLGSHLELMDVSTGKRKIIFSENVSFQAPNWTVDGKSLIYNREGLLYNFDLQTNKPTVINTDFANRNNNDHVLSFDGKMLAISSNHSKEDNNTSLVFTVPTTGGVPFRVTATGPSYLHGWSPDKKYLLFTGQRDGDYDIYQIPAKGGKEVKLTTTKGLDDGPEYSPDGKWIYYNSVRSGTMQVWRMKPDGGGNEQLTNDEFNNWFPHVSPDGKWIVYIAFEKDVPPGDHPFYKHVFLKLIPIPDGKTGLAKPKTIAYLFGGQGTINVPSWSPDSKRIAFVSNSDFNEPKK